MNTELTKAESLKALMENRGAGSQIEQTRAEMNLGIYERTVGKMSYEECMLLVEQAEAILENTDALDPSFEFFSRQKTTMLRYAQALNDVRSMGRTEHLFPVNILLEVDGTSTECVIHLSRASYYPQRRQHLIQSTIMEKLNMSSEWRGGYRHIPKVDFVEL